MGTMQTSPFAQAPMEASAVYSDMDMKVHCVLDDEAIIWIFHDKPFLKTLSWIEYDLGSSRIDFVLEDGDIRNFGVPVDRRFGRYLQNMHSISVVLKNGSKVIDGEVYPLIMHAA